MPDGQDTSGYYQILEGDFRNFVIEVSDYKLDENLEPKFAWSIYRVPNHITEEYINENLDDITDNVRDILEVIVEKAVKKVEDERSRNNNTNESPEE